MTYADYQYYTESFGGTMPAPDFARLSRQASAYLDRVTFDRIAVGQPDEIRARVKDACCAVADTYFALEKSAGVVSESNDGLSVTYDHSSKTDGQKLYDAAALYLGGTGLLYRGVD